MARRRKIGGANVSFFAFQDIITAVSGILILIVIFLILMLEQPGLMAVPSEEENDLALDDLETLVSEAKERVRELEFRKLEAIGASPDLLKAEIDQLEAQAGEGENTGARALRERIEAIKRETAELNENAAEQQAELDRIAGNADELRGRVESKADELDRSLTASKIWYRPGASEKKPLVFVVGRNQAESLDFENPDQKQWLGEKAFERLLKDSNRRLSYCVFLIRPEGIPLFRTLSKIARDEGFEIGYRALDSETLVDVLPESSRIP